jgi:hypothetical protein
MRRARRAGATSAANMNLTADVGATIAGTPEGSALKTATTNTGVRYLAFRPVFATGTTFSLCARAYFLGVSTNNCRVVTGPRSTTVII